MINGGYLIPANTKKGQLIFGMFTGSDLMLFDMGAFGSLVLLLTIGANETLNAVICILPALICGFLIAPIPNYRNVITFISSAINFYSNQTIYKWRGWCFYEQSNERK